MKYSNFYFNKRLVNPFASILFVKRYSIAKDSLLYFYLNHRFCISTCLNLVLIRFKAFVTSLIICILLQKIVRGKENASPIFLRSLPKAMLFLAIVPKT